MNEKIKKLLENRGENYIFPFFWQHGEEEEVLRKYMEVIHNCGIGAVCVESRPHPDFCGDKWWKDLDVILDEARKREMQVWILDDSHFPTGYCNGQLEKEPITLRRQSVTYRIVGEAAEGEEIKLAREDYRSPLPFEPNAYEAARLPNPETFLDDVFLGVTAVKAGGEGDCDIILLEEKDGEICFQAGEGRWKLYACYLTRNRGPHRNYMNMMDEESCHKLIEAVYEPHYLHYKEEFGKTIAGFFSDEPEIGNGHIYETGKTLEEVDDQPWSREVEAELQKRWGGDFRKYLPLLWDRDFQGSLKARVRYDFMDTVTRCVEKDFSWQIGDWCRARGVEYIGHLIEDNNQHSRCGSSLGHFFRGLAGQDMAGIDNIGGQVMPQMEDDNEYCYKNRIRDSVFYHYGLGRLAASAAAIEPLKKGRSMCEIFGDYGWAEGVRLEKYLADHFMVRGINHYVPHAFSPKAFPDPDCPPHFYAHGHNPQYRHFGMLMRYMNRVCELISDGRQVSRAAVLYHGDADWAGGICMYSQVPARKLADAQIQYDFIPSDVFTDKKYHTVLGKHLKVNTQEYHVLIIPEASYITADMAEAAAALAQAGCRVLFVNSLPGGICHGKGTLAEGIREDEEKQCLDALKVCSVAALEELPDAILSDDVSEVSLFPSAPLVRALHYQNGSDMFYFVNEAADTYEGVITIRREKEGRISDSGSSGNYHAEKPEPCYAYDAWSNRLERLSPESCPEGVRLSVVLEPQKSLIVLFDEAEENFLPSVSGGENTFPDKNGQAKEMILANGWRRSLCRAVDYPDYREEKEVSLPDFVEKEKPDFGGYIRYEKRIKLPGTVSSAAQIILEITDAAEGVEVFVNGVSAGIQIVPVYRYDITDMVKEGENLITIEVATTLERAVPTTTQVPGAVIPPPVNHCGITGCVRLRVNN